jgi:hypothetical protein
MPAREAELARLFGGGFSEWGSMGLARSCRDGSCSLEESGADGKGRGVAFGRGQDMQGSLFVRVVGRAYVGFVWCIARRYGTFLGL